MSPLWLLIRLQLGGWLRFVAKGLATPRGAILAALGMGMLLMWLAALLSSPDAGAMAAEGVPRYGPAFLILFCVASVVFSPHDRGLYFSPAEVQWLFPAPFTRRQLVAYKVVLALLGSLPTALILGVAVRVRQGWLPAVAIGMFLLISFVQIFSLALGVFGAWMGAALHTRLRVGVGLLTLALVGGGLAWLGVRTGWDGQEMARLVLDSSAWRAVTYPVESFFAAMVARGWESLWLPALIGLGVNLLLLAALFAFDANYLESAAAASAHLYARMQRAQGKKVTVEVSGTERRRRWGLPMLPYLGGVGPVAWRQLTTAWRSPGRFLLLLAILGGVLAAPLMGGSMGDERPEMTGLVLGMGLWLSMFLSVLVPFDFRGDIDRMGLLKTLPVAPWRLALGQTVAPTLLLTLVHWCVLGALMAVTPGRRELLGQCLVFAPAFNFYMVALDNLLFLFFPVRVQASTPGDFQAVGRNVLLSLGKLMGLLVPLVAVGIGALIAAVAGSWWLWALIAAPLTVGVGTALVALAGLAFTWYDVGRDAPA